MGKNGDTAKHGQAHRSGTVLNGNAQEHTGIDYRDYSFSWKERLLMMSQYLLLSGGFAYLFYRSWTVLAVFWCFYPFFRRRRKIQHMKKRQDILCRQFKDSIQCAATSMAGSLPGDADAVWATCLNDKRAAVYDNMYVVQYSFGAAFI